MANTQIKNDTVAWVPITTVDSAGDIVPAPSGDVFSVVSSDPAKVAVAIGVMPSGPQVGAVAFSVTPLVRLAPGIIVKITDTAALTEDDPVFDIVADVVPSAIKADVVDAVFVPQPVPVA